jgi:hypothetical protein
LQVLVSFPIVSKIQGCQVKPMFPSREIMVVDV